MFVQILIYKLSTLALYPSQNSSYIDKCLAPERFCINLQGPVVYKYICEKVFYIHRPQTTIIGILYSTVYSSYLKLKYSNNWDNQSHSFSLFYLFYFILQDSPNNDTHYKKYKK